MLFKNKLPRSLLILLLLALTLRLVVIINSKITFYSDDAAYAQLAKFLVGGDLKHFFHPTWQPLFPAISALVFLVVDNWELSLRLTSATAGVLLAIPAYFLARHTLPVLPAALFAGCLPFFYPILATSLAPLSDMLATLFIVTTISCGFIAIKNNNGRFLTAASVFAGIGFLTRSEGLLLFLLTIFYFSTKLVFLIIRKKAPAGRFAWVGLATLVFFLTISPYIVATRIQLGKWTLSQKFSAQIKQGHAFALNHNQTTWSQEVVSIKSPTYNSEYFSSGLSHVIEYNDWFLWWGRQKFQKWKDLFFNLFPYWAAVAILVGIATLVRKDLIWSLAYVLFVMIVAVPATIFSTAVTDIRYLVWTFPLFLWFFWVGIRKVVQILPTTFRADVLIPLIASLFLPAFSWYPIIDPLGFANQTTHTYQKLEIFEAGSWLKQNSKNPKIMMRHEGVEFYAEGETIYTPQITYIQLLDYARSKNAEYIVAWKEELDADPNLAILVDQKNRFADLESVYHYPNQEPKIIIYKILPEKKL